MPIFWGIIIVQLCFEKFFPLLSLRVRRGKAGGWGEKMLGDLRIRECDERGFCIYGEAKKRNVVVSFAFGKKEAAPKA